MNELLKVTFVFIGLRAGNHPVISEQVLRTLVLYV